MIVFSLADLNGSNEFRPQGVTFDGNLARMVSSTGNFNDDGVDDLLIGASAANSSYVIFGSRGFGGGAHGFCHTYTNDDAVLLVGTNLMIDFVWRKVFFILTAVEFQR